MRAAHFLVTCGLGSLCSPPTAPLALARAFRWVYSSCGSSMGYIWATSPRQDPWILHLRVPPPHGPWTLFLGPCPNRKMGPSFCERRNTPPSLPPFLEVATAMGGRVGEGGVAIKMHRYMLNPPNRKRSLREWAQSCRERLRHKRYPTLITWYMFRAVVLYPLYIPYTASTGFLNQRFLKQRNGCTYIYIYNTYIYMCTYTCPSIFLTLLSFENRVGTA